jgi:flagellin
MPISIASNIASLKAQTRLARTTSQLNTSFERLSSGLRINSAADDPAGLIVADALRAQSRIASVAIRNANDGISLVAIADASLGEISSVLSRMAELAQQSATGTYTQTQRSSMASEYLALGSEVARIARVTEFNGMTLLSNSTSINIQVGFNGGTNSTITIGAVSGTLNALGLAIDNGAALTNSIIATTSTGSQTAASLALDVVTSAINAVNINRGTLGAAQSRLSTAINYLGVVRENFVAAESKIRDVDVAQEVAEMVRLQVLQQSGSAILAQANQQPALALSLLQ